MTLANIFRIIKRDSLSLFTNITGLSLGLAASILLTVFIQFELSFDRYFSNSERIFRLNSIWIDEGEKEIMPINLREAYTSIPVQTPGIESAVQLYRGWGREVSNGENRYKGLQLLFADPEFFQLFDLKFLEGSPERSLAEPGVVVLTEKIAIRIFGNAQAMGKTLEMENETYTVSAVIENIPPNTHFRFDMLMPMISVPNLEQLGGLEFFSYYLLKDGVDPQPVLKTICDENTRILSERFSSFENASLHSTTEPLEELHLHSSANWDLTSPGSMKNIIIMLIIAISVMLLALFNFINLFILNGAKRSKEIGIRKVNGANRKRMIYQFYFETTVVVTISFIMAALIALILIPEFGRIMQRDSFMEITRSPGLYLLLVAVYLVTIILSGFYPALLLSKAEPIPLILGRVNPALDKKALLSLVSIFQISVAIFLLATLLGINTQTRYLKNLSPGYNPVGIIMLYNLNERLTEDYQALRDRLLNIREIEEVAASVHTIGAGYSGQGIRMSGEHPNQSKSISEYRIQPGLCSLYQFNLVHGRFLDPERIADSKGVILNVAAVAMLGSTPEEIVGESVVMHSDPLEVVGVVENFLYESAARQVEPLVLTAYQDRIRSISVRINPDADPQELLGSINKTMTSFDEAYIMINRFASELYNEYYKGEERLQNIMGAGSLLSVIIVLLGIYALVSHNIVSRTKEIGIRKVMGGSTTRMMTLIYTSTLKWTAIATLIAVPLSWLYLNKWLNDYSVRITQYWWIFVCSVLLIVIFQTVITLGQTWKTARRNPVEALRYE